jgi:hypothetical protein
MLKQFSSNSRRLNRVIPKINQQNLANLDLTGSLNNISIPSQNKFESKTKQITHTFVHNNSVLNTDTNLTSSLLNIELPSTQSFQSKTKSNLNPIKLVNNKTKISDFYQEILEFSARYVERRVDEFDNVNNTLTIRNVYTDYGTEGASPENFEVLVFGLHIPGDYTIAQVENNLVITLNNDYIDFDNVTINDIYVIGKLVDIPIAAENDIVLSTEGGLDLII